MNERPDGYTLAVSLVPSTSRPSGLSRSTIILMVYGALALLAGIWGAWRGAPRIYRFADTPVTAGGVALHILLGAAVGGVVVFLSRYAVHRLEWARVLHREFAHLLGPISRREIWVLALASSIAEECFFRGALVPHVGIWLSSLLFALAHVGPGVRFLPWTVSSLVMGLVFGLEFRWGGDLAAPITTHFVINYLNLHFIARGPLS